ncbi:MAG: ubiquinol-cytochrome c reductase iron-sulfur subunit [Alphaproteobacteria bacterium]|nr:ubiquinol-cytochrome c reductase iron-sulfur subunit [Alphaproteobacteria bacterium]
MSHHTPSSESSHEPTRRDFMALAAGGMAAVGGCAAVWPFIDSMNPAADTLALSTIEVDLSPIQTGQTVRVKWRGVPVFIRHRTQENIDEARAVALADLKDPQTDEERVKQGKDQWLVMVGVCTHLGCIPVNDAGEYNGWFCPCHGSHYDTSGRIRKGPAPTNLAVPKYEFIADNRIKIG